MLTEIVEWASDEKKGLGEISDAYKDTNELVKRLKIAKKNADTDKEGFRLYALMLLSVHLLSRENSETYNCGAQLYLLLHPRYDKFLEQLKTEFRKKVY